MPDPADRVVLDVGDWKLNGITATLFVLEAASGEYAEIVTLRGMTGKARSNVTEFSHKVVSELVGSWLLPGERVIDVAAPAQLGLDAYSDDPGVLNAKSLSWIKKFFRDFWSETLWLLVLAIILGSLEVGGEGFFWAADHKENKRADAEQAGDKEKPSTKPFIIFLIQLAVIVLVLLAWAARKLFISGSFRGLAVLTNGRAILLCFRVVWRPFQQAPGGKSGRLSAPIPALFCTQRWLLHYATALDLAVAARGDLNATGLALFCCAKMATRDRHAVALLDSVATSGQYPRFAKLADKFRQG